jgi:hypothetical protein
MKDASLRGLHNTDFQLCDLFEEAKYRDRKISGSQGLEGRMAY